MRTSQQSAPPSGDRRSGPPPLVGIGASAGGIPALRDFLAAVPEDSGIAFVVIMHLSPEHESHLAEVLQSAAPIPVQQVTQRTPIAGDCVYVIPPGLELIATDAHLEVVPFAEPHGRRAAVDAFFRTIAAAHPDGVGVILSGSGSDGVVGIKAIKEAGGLILAQDPEEAEHPTMPRSAIATGLVDVVLPAGQLGARVAELRGRGVVWTAPDPGGLGQAEAEDLRRILDHLREQTGHDFQGYKRSTMLRRIARRMQVNRAPELGSYLDVLQESPAEAHALLKDLLISVTSFFRDRAGFEALEHRVIPPLLDRQTDAGEVRVWVPGCATGEEAYSVAMLLAEYAERKHMSPRIQVFATDLDRDAVAHAREGIYPDAIAGDVGEDRLKRFFRRRGAHFRVTKELREMLLFTHHDVLRDPPFSRLDLITCRNLLIYMEPELQERLLGIFRYALRPHGRLFLGPAETAPEKCGFRAVDKEHRIYQRSGSAAAGPAAPPPLSFTPGPTRLPGMAGLRRRGPAQEVAASALHAGALEEYAPTSILVDGEHTILHSSGGAGRYLEFHTGMPTVNLLKVARPELRLALRTALFQALERGVASCSGWIPVTLDQEPRVVQVYAAPRPGEDGATGALVLFLEFPAGNAGAAGPAPPANRGLDEAEAELGSARERLQEMMDASETRQEELGEANEELQSINEEYRSTLEELETSKEELQSMNEELSTVNAELNSRLTELAQANDDLRNLMDATQIGTLFVDRSLRLKRYTPALAEIFNVRAVDEGRPLAHLTHGLDYPELISDCESVLRSLQPTEREVDAVDGSAWLARITPYRTKDDRIGGVVATFTEVSRIRAAQRRVQESEERFRVLVDATAEIVWAMDRHGLAVEDSPSWRAFTGQPREDWHGAGWLAAVHPEDRTAVRAAWTRAVDAEAPMEAEFRLFHAPSGEWRVTSVRAVPVRNGDGSVREWVGMNTDVTERRAAEQALRDAKAAAEAAAEAKNQFLATMSHELRTPLTAVIGLSELMETGVVGEMNETQRKHLKRIKLSAWHLVSIIDEVLTFSRSEAGRTVAHRTTTDLAEIARAVVDVLEVSAVEKGLALSLESGGRPEFAFSDPGKVRQVMTNLVGNAIKFTDRGSVTVAVKGMPRHVEFLVRDTGPGIPADRFEAIFEPFVQLDSTTTREKGGTGLGLAVSRRLTDILGGQIEVQSEPGAGSTFILRLPREPEAAMEGFHRE